MKTPIEQLIVELEDLRDSIPDSDAMYRGGVINAIRLAKDIIKNKQIWRNQIDLSGEISILEWQVDRRLCTIIAQRLTKKTQKEYIASIKTNKI